nr:Gfo/Idh/MocA family oxidoreductase [Pseudarthrobacter psychrotolerans]
MSEKLRWGVLGTARIVRKTIPALQETKNGEVVGIASRTEEKAKEYADKHGVPQAFGSYEALLASPDIDAVYIALPNALHLEWILKSLDAGKHVLCEKPLAMSAAECEEITRKADQTGLKVLEGFMYRFHARFEKLQELLAANAVGKLTFVHVGHSFDAGGDDNIRWYAGLGGGSLFDTGCYCVNVSRMVTAQEPAHVAAFGNYRDANDEGRIDTSIAGMLRFPGSATALFDTGVNLERRNFLELTGTGAGSTSRILLGSWKRIRSWRSITSGRTRSITRSRAETTSYGWANTSPAASSTARRSATISRTQQTTRGCWKRSTRQHGNKTGRLHRAHIEPWPGLALPWTLVTDDGVGGSGAEVPGRRG